MFDILEDISSQNRSTLAAVEAMRVALLERIDRFEQRVDSRFNLLEAALQSNYINIASLEGKSRL